MFVLRSVISPRLWAAALTLLAPALAPSPAWAQAPAPGERVMGHEVYETWKTIGNEAISPDGRWVHYTLDLENSDGSLVVREVDGTRAYAFPRGSGATFAAGSSRVVFTLRPARDGENGAGATGGARAGARGRDVGEAAARRDTLGLLDLASGDLTRIPDVRSSRVVEATDRILIHLHSTEEGVDEGPLVIHDLSTGSEQRVDRVSTFEVSGDGSTLVYVAPGGEGMTRVVMLPLTGGTPEILLEAAGEATRPALDEGGDRVAFLFQPAAAEGAAENPHVLYLRQPGGNPASPLVSTGTPGLQPGWRVSPDRTPAFSGDASRLVFGTTPRPLSPAAYASNGGIDAGVEVEVWHWQEPELMTVQNVRLAQAQRRNFVALVHLDNEERVIQLADEDMADVDIHDNWDGAFGLGSSTRPYAVQSSWETPSRRDVYRVDPSTGERTLLLEGVRSNPSLSPGGRYLSWWDGEDRTWWALELSSGERIALNQGIPHPVHNERHDSPSPPGSYGSPGWTEDDDHVLLYDRFDLWAVDPSSPGSPTNVTRGAGREAGIRLRAVRPRTRADGSIVSDSPLLLSAFHERSKRAGFYAGNVAGSEAPRALVFEDRSFSTPVKAAEADRYLFTRETFRDFPDLWVAGADFADPVRVSEANPQQAQYRWGSAELVEWVSQDGVDLQGVLLKPDDFDPSRTYPMVVYFYERMSDGLHSHFAPVPHRSRISFPMYTSRDYLVFIPDIVYRQGFPGESALNAVVPGVMHLMNQGFVDRDRIGLQGHSWGGYQIAYMVTRTGTLFRAAAPGAPVANMTSAYGGIRRDSGLVRNFNYESTQSRIGESLWEAPLRYIENSPLFWLDKVETPLLIMHNDRDGAVPQEQGVELFTAMRRLGKPAWLINYVGEPHWPTTFPNRRDWNIRMQQFFDHYLKDAPPPGWMVEGIPALRRSETLGLDLVEPAPPAAEQPSGDAAGAGGAARR